MNDNVTPNTDSSKLVPIREGIQHAGHAFNNAEIEGLTPRQRAVLTKLTVNHDEQISTKELAELLGYSRERDVQRKIEALQGAGFEFRALMRENKRAGKGRNSKTLYLSNSEARIVINASTKETALPIKALLVQLDEDNRNNMTTMYAAVQHLQDETITRLARKDAEIDLLKNELITTQKALISAQKTQAALPTAERTMKQQAENVFAKYEKIRQLPVAPDHDGSNRYKNVFMWYSEYGGSYGLNGQQLYKLERACENYCNVNGLRMELSRESEWGRIPAFPMTIIPGCAYELFKAGQEAASV